MCYMSTVENLLARLTADALRADELHAQSRSLLVSSVRAGAAAGLSQREIAAAIGRSQPEVSRLLRFHGHSPRARQLMQQRSEVIDLVRHYGGRNPRVFGSVALGTDTPASDIDLLVDFSDAPSLFELARLEAALAASLGFTVDVVSSQGLRAHMKSRVLSEAVPL